MDLNKPKFVRRKKLEIFRGGRERGIVVLCLSNYDLWILNTPLKELICIYLCVSLENFSFYIFYCPWLYTKTSKKRATLTLQQEVIQSNDIFFIDKNYNVFRIIWLGKKLDLRQLTWKSPYCINNWPFQPKKRIQFLCN